MPRKSKTKRSPAVAAIETPSPADAAPGPETSPAATKIATLGGPPVDIAAEKPVQDKPVVRRKLREDWSEIRWERERERRIAHRRRLAARARYAVQPFQQQQQTTPFGQSGFPATR